MPDTVVSPARDPFDAVDYNPIDHLNALFSSPSSLSSLPAVRTTLLTHQHSLDRTITTRASEQRARDLASVSRIQTAQSQLSGLFSQIESVQQRALDTEASITTMTSDIKRLDATKRNLTHSMTTLKRLQMLTSAYEQLRALKGGRQYKECAGLLAAVLQLMAHFKSYRSIDQIAELSKGVAELQRELLEQVCEDFELAFARGEVAVRKGMLAEGTGVVDALGEHARTRLVNWYCNTQLREYRMVFRGSEEAGNLDNIARRYSWFGRMLKTFDAEHRELFPREWRVDEMLANAFCEGTREDYKGILQKSMRRTEGGTPDVNLLLSCLQETLEFENGLEKRFRGDESRTSLDSMSSVKQEKKQGFSQAISEAFEPYLSIWVDSQDRQLSMLIPKYRLQPIRNADEEYHAQMVISSSTELFNVYRVTLAQCAKLSTGSRLLELSRTFGKYLDQYCQQVLFYHLAERSGVSGPSVEDIAVILNTADYCYQTTSQLEERIKTRIDEDFREQVDLQSQADAFMGIASTCVRTLVRKVEVDCEPAWREMRNITWSKLPSVGDQSGFMTSMIQRMKDRSTEILANVHKPQYARAFTDNLVDALVTAYISNIVSCRPISESGAEQMLLDSYALKSGLLGLGSMPSGPPAADAPSAPRNPNLLKRVSTALARLDPLLKTLQVTPSPPEALVQAYLIHIHDRSESNFRKILDLKGIRSRAETNTLIELFNAHRDSPSYSTPGNTLQESNPVVGNLNLMQSNHGPSGSISGLNTAEGSRNVSLNLSALGMHPGGASSTPSLVPGNTRFDPTGLGEKLLTAARDGVSAVDNRFGSPALGSGGGFAGRSGTPPPPPPPGGGGGALATGMGTGAVGEGGLGGSGSLNENLRNIGKFFKREGQGFRRGTPDPERR
ncbi:Vacuolar protein sorting-associated protein 53 [Sphaceloma murrayae]|uniref:Vacuolar protein sorting-associated protein 53 n=1 Tax=Sphaceloma murrayae TaxID=2082308 RepID=A0A2K1QSP0_9PEZI|nr:Vacuolar protein sorting-associated protein 53 [Sphaceloma murrayae]